LKQCGIIFTENGTKGSQHPKKVFEMSFKKDIRNISTFEIPPEK